MVSAVCFFSERRSSYIVGGDGNAWRVRGKKTQNTARKNKQRRCGVGGTCQHIQEWPKKERRRERVYEFDGAESIDTAALDETASGDNEGTDAAGS